MLKNQTGSALLYSLVALALIGGGSMFMLQRGSQSKTDQVDASTRQKIEQLRRLTSAVLANGENCKASLAGTISESPRAVASIRKADGTITYFNSPAVDTQKPIPKPVMVKQMTIKLVSPPEDLPQAKFELEVPLSVKIAGKKQRLVRNLKFPLRGTVLEGKIDSCSFDFGNIFDNAVAQGLAKVCNGPGKISITDAGTCRMVRTKETAQCPQGKAVGKVQYVGDVLTITCEPIVNRQGTNNEECKYGVKYTSTTGDYDCLELSEIVNSTTAKAAIGKSCNVAVENGQFIFKCSGTGTGPGTAALDLELNDPSPSGCQPVNCGPGTYKCCPGSNINNGCCYCRNNPSPYGDPEQVECINDVGGLGI